MVKAFFQYYREESHPRGCVAVLVDTEAQVFKTGWSLYNKNHETRPFTKKLARIIAVGRTSDGVLARKWLDKGIIQDRKSVV